MPAVLIPELNRIDGATRFAAEIMKAMQSSFCQQILDGGAVAVAIEPEIYDFIVGAASVARTTNSMQVKTNPTVDLYRQTLLALTALGASQGLVGVAIGGYWARSNAVFCGWTVSVRRTPFSLTADNDAA